MDGRKTELFQAVEVYERHLYREERGSRTVEKYLRDVRRFLGWLGERELTRELASEWKAALQAQGYAPVTVNSMLAAVNGFFRVIGREDCRVKFLRIQRRMFREPARELTRGEYLRLLETAAALGRERLALLMETIGASGIRASEVRYITVEAARQGGDRPEGEDPRHPAACKAVPEAAEICPKEQNRLRRDISHRKR